MPETYKAYTSAEVRAAGAEGRFTAVSLFSGGGGSSCGLNLAGADVRAAVEFSPWATAVYQRNHPTTPIIQRSVRDIAGDPAGIEYLLGRAGLRVGQLDYLQSSPPCQPHSAGGRGMGDPSRITLHSGVEQTYAATLPFEVAKLTHKILPKVAVMENVPGLVRRTPDFFERILESFRFGGSRRLYYTNWKIVSADDFGVPQRRRRVFAVSIRKDVARGASIGCDADVLDVFPRPVTRAPVSIRSALSCLEQTTEDERPFFESIRRSRLPSLLRALPPCPTRPRRLKNVTSYFTLVRCSWDHPAPTLVIAGQKPDGLSGAIHPELDRKFTIPELKRLFALPEDYQLVGTIEQAIDTICNMVPPPLERAIAESVFKHVLQRSTNL